MENERLRITLDRSDRTYMSGQWIKGNIWMNLTKRTKIKTIKVLVRGKGKCKWIEILRKSSNESRGLFYSSKEIYAHSVITVPAFESRAQEFQVGEHSFEFALQLDMCLPSSFRGSHGSIKYKMTVIISRPWTFDERRSIPLIVVKNMPMPCYSVPRPLEKQITKTINLFGAKPITMVAMLPTDCATIGAPLRICVTVTNNSTTNVEKLKFTILQHIMYYSHHPLRILKKESVAIANKETGSINKKSERSFAHEIIIPEKAQPSDEEYSGIINISYELKVVAVLRGFSKNFGLDLPFTLYSRELTSSSAYPSASYGVNRESSLSPIQQQQHNDSSCSRRSTGTIVYPNMDGSITSPSHSMYSESSSITTSDSSTSTLAAAWDVLPESLGNESSSGLSNSYPPYVNQVPTDRQETPIAAESSLRRRTLTPTDSTSDTDNENSYALAEDVPSNNQRSLSPRSSNRYSLSPNPSSSCVLDEDISSNNHRAQFTRSSNRYSLSPNPSYAYPSSSWRASTPTNTSPASLYLHRILHPANHELPPSYEELFGNEHSDANK